jgi:hypothetical protein
MENMLKNNYDKIVNAAYRLVKKLMSDGRPMQEVIDTLKQFGMDESFLAEVERINVFD